jgi:hypothetical protein
MFKDNKHNFVAQHFIEVSGFNILDNEKSSFRFYRVN